MQGGSPDRVQETVSAAHPVQDGAVESVLYAPQAVPQRRTARKRMGAAAGSNAAAASPVLAPSPSSAVPAPQKSQASNMIRPRTLEQPQGAPPAQRPGPSASGQQQQPAPFDLSAAMRGRQSGQAPSTVASPDQARQAGHSIPPPAVAARTVPEAQTQRPAHQASAGHALAPAQAMGRSELPQQTFGLLGKRAAEPGHEPPAKRAKRSDGSLLGLANMVIRDFARRRLGGAAGNPSGVSCKFLSQPHMHQSVPRGVFHSEMSSERLQGSLQAIRSSGVLLAL